MCFEIEIVSAGLKVLVLAVLLNDSLVELVKAYSKKKEETGVVFVVLDEDGRGTAAEDSDKEDEIGETQVESKSD